jgi:ribosomal protein L9
LNTIPIVPRVSLCCEVTVPVKVHREVTAQVKVTIVAAQR